jgi:hypothetical protein
MLGVSIILSLLKQLKLLQAKATLVISIVQEHLNRRIRDGFVEILCFRKVPFFSYYKEILYIFMRKFYSFLCLSIFDFLKEACFLFVCLVGFGSAGNQTKGFVGAGQVLPHQAASPGQQVLILKV